MNVTRHMIEDLLPLYASGEVSADTRSAVERFLKDDPELARMLSVLTTSDPLGGVTEPLSAERAALTRTKSLLRARTWLLAVGIFVTVMPFSFAFGSDEGVQFWMLRDAPVASGASLAAAAVVWVAYGLVVRKLRVTGL